LGVRILFQLVETINMIYMCMRYDDPLDVLWSIPQLFQVSVDELLVTPQAGVYQRDALFYDQVRVAADRAIDRMDTRDQFYHMMTKILWYHTYLKHIPGRLFSCPRLLKINAYPKTMGCT